MKRRSPRELEKMINVRVGGKQEEKEGKKCDLAGRNEKKKKNMSCTTTSKSRTATGRIINKPSKMDFVSLSPQLHHFEAYTYCISFTRRRNSSRYHSSTSYPFTWRSLGSTATILSLFLLYIVIMPVSGLANDMLPSSTTTTTSSYVTSSTGKSLVVNSQEPHVDSVQGTRALENHHHHPHSSHLEELPSSDEPAPNGQKETSGQHKCYVCLPPDKTSRDAEEILSIFPEETRARIPDCTSFGTHNAKHFEFKCPPDYAGCLLRIRGKNESRSCERHPLNDCMTLNSVELCYCTGALCNESPSEIVVEETESDERARAQLEDEKEERETRKIWQKGETDDEDLLGPHHVDIDGMQDDDYGSGSEPPPNLYHQYTSTAQPTLRPNIPPNRTMTTPASTSGGSWAFGRKLSAVKIPFTSVTIPSSYALCTLVPLLLSFISQSNYLGIYQGFNL